MGLHVAMIGGGMVSKVHLEVMFSHPLISAVSLCEVDPLALEDLSSQYPFKSSVVDYQKLLDDHSVDLVDICLPHDLHYPVTMQAIQAGKHVILEKPISNSLPEADEMIAAAEQAGLRFYVALNERFLPVHQRVRELLSDGVIGRPVLAALIIAGTELPRMQQPDHWKGSISRAGGGVLADSGTHAVDLALDWFGEPDSVLCSLGKFVVKPANKADDTVCLLLNYPDKLVNISMTYAAAGQPWSERRNIWGELGSIHIQIESEHPIQVWQDGRVMPQDVEHDAHNWWVYSVKLGLTKALDCLESDQDFPVTPHDARKVLRIIRAAYLSAALKRQVTLDETEGASFQPL